MLTILGIIKGVMSVEEVSNVDKRGGHLPSSSSSSVITQEHGKAGSSFSSAFSNLKTSEFFSEANEVSLSGSAQSTASKSPVKVSGSTTNAVLVSPKQRGNPLLRSITSVPWEFCEITPDYVMGKTTCALFLSLRYHNLNPDYINDRLKKLGKEYELRVLLVQVDTKDPHHSLKTLVRVCILADLTLMLAWSPEEAGKIIETYKVFENKPPDLIMERQENSPYQKLINSLTSIRSVNKTDASTLLATFGSLRKIVKSSPDSLSLCPGLGPQKAARLHKVLHQPFLRDRASTAKSKNKSVIKR